jgi:hypothetical protein
MQLAQEHMCCWCGVRSINNKSCNITTIEINRNDIKKIKSNLEFQIINYKREEIVNMVNLVIYLIVINLQLFKNVNFFNQIIIIFSLKIFYFHIIFKSGNRCVI